MEHRRHGKRPLPDDHPQPRRPRPDQSPPPPQAWAGSGSSAMSSRQPIGSGGGGAPGLARRRAAVAAGGRRGHRGRRRSLPRRAGRATLSWNQLTGGGGRWGLQPPPPPLPCRPWRRKVRTCYSCTHVIQLSKYVIKLPWSLWLTVSYLQEYRSIGLSIY